MIKMKFARRALGETRVVVVMACRLGRVVKSAK